MIGGNQGLRSPVLLQTVDKRTFRDLKGFNNSLTFEGFDPNSASDVALALLCLKIRIEYFKAAAPLTLLIDEGRKKRGTPFGKEIFCDWPAAFAGSYESSAREPLLQLADFFAFCVNRNTYLTLKSARTDMDHWFLGFVKEMRIKCKDIVPALVGRSFSVVQINEFHRLDRGIKGIAD